ncbi:hypothetical protein PLESTM_000751200 [Pleodorina starrii]|nr:hypothetical protein PLESTM_000751200 [Pleodorina starrii]
MEVFRRASGQRLNLDKVEVLPLGPAPDAGAAAALVPAVRAPAAAAAVPVPAPAAASPPVAASATLLTLLRHAAARLLMLGGRDAPSGRAAPPPAPAGRRSRRRAAGDAGSQRIFSSLRQLVLRGVLGYGELGAAVDASGPSISEQLDALLGLVPVSWVAAARLVASGAVAAPPAREAWAALLQGLALVPSWRAAHARPGTSVKRGTQLQLDEGVPCFARAP